MAFTMRFFSVPSLNQWSSSLGLFCHIPLKRDQCDEIACACCIWNVIYQNSSLNPWFSSLGLFCHIPLKRDRCDEIACACCIWNVMYQNSSLNPWFTSLGLFCHIPLKKDPWDWDWRLRLNDTPNASDYTWNTKINPI